MFSFVITAIPWNAQIEDQAVHCTDIGFGFFFVDMYTHKAAGDTVSVGWTWEKLEAVRIAYEFTFFAIWFIISTILLLIFLRPRGKRAELRLA